MNAKPALRALLRAVLARLVPIVSTRPWAVRLAARAFVLFPSLKLRLRRIVSQPSHAPVRSRVLDDAQTRVLMDLRDAARKRR